MHVTLWNKIAPPPHYYQKRKENVAKFFHGANFLKLIYIYLLLKVNNFIISNQKMLVPLITL